jgi:starch synthase (maltosyl-transferring)
VRRHHPALRRQRGARVHGADNPQLFVYSRMTRSKDDVVLVVANLDPWNVQSGYLQLDLATLGLPASQAYVVADQLTGESYEWVGANPWVRLDPDVCPGHVLALRPLPG